MIGPDPFDIKRIVRERIAQVCDPGGGRGTTKNSQSTMSYRRLSRLAGVRPGTVSEVMRDVPGCLSFRSLESLCVILDLQLVPSELLPSVQSRAFRKTNTILTHKLRELNAQSSQG